LDKDEDDSDLECQPVKRAGPVCKAVRAFGQVVHCDSQSDPGMFHFAYFVCFSSFFKESKPQQTGTRLLTGQGEVATTSGSTSLRPLRSDGRRLPRRSLSTT